MTKIFIGGNRQPEYEELLKKKKKRDKFTGIPGKKGDGKHG